MLSWQTIVWGLAILAAGLLIVAIVVIARKLFGTRRDEEAAAEPSADERASLPDPAVFGARDRSASCGPAPVKSAPLPPLPGTYEYDYFISYNKEWDHIAALVAEVLAQEGKTVSAWVQRYDSKRGENLVSQVSSAIAKSKHFIALLSEAYISRPWTMQELNWFVGHRLDHDPSDRKLIVLKCEDLGDKEKDVPVLLKRSSTARFSTSPSTKPRGLKYQARSGATRPMRGPRSTIISTRKSARLKASRGANAKSMRSPNTSSR